MTEIKGMGEMTMAELNEELGRGGKFVMYPYCFSILVMTFRRNSDIYFIRAGESRFVKGLPFALLSLFLGWWGIPWGLIWTPIVLFQTLTGGKDVTNEVVTSLQPVPPPVVAPPVVSRGPQNPWASGQQ